MVMNSDPIALAHAAASAIERLCATLDDCAREVDARGGQRVARAMLAHDMSVAAMALMEVYRVLIDRPAMSYEISDMITACHAGYVRPWMALRVVRLASEVAHLEATHG